MDFCGNESRYLTHKEPALPSYINQSIDLHSKLIGWFLSDSNTGT